MSRDQFSAIYDAGSTLTGARLKRTRTEWSLGAPETQELPPPPDASADGAVQTGASHEVRHFTASFPDTVTYCIDSGAAQFQFLSIPVADDAEIPDMVSLQLEERKLLPLEASEMTIAYETLEKTGEDLRLLAVAVPTRTLDTIPTTTGLSKARIHRIDIGALAALRALRDDPKSPLFAAGRHLLLLDETDTWTLVVIDNSQPILVRTLGVVTAPPRILLRLVRLSLLQAEAEQGSASPILSITVLADTLDPAFSTALADAFGAPVALAKAGYPEPSATPIGQSEKIGEIGKSAAAVAAAAGAARRSAEGASFDLVPFAWREELADRAHRRTLLRIIVGGIALWVLAAAALFFGPSLLDKAIASEEASIRTLDPAVQKVSDVRHRVRLIRTYMDRTFSPLEVLREVSLLLPDGITLNTLRYARKDSRVIVSANATSTALVYEFKQHVDGSEMFRESQLTSGPTTNTRTGGADFELTILLNTPPEEGDAAQ